ncbi:F-box protein At5g03100 [Brachypodium distachyon]|uniref:F-box protein At5g03100 n=1 Tax=Brachypodium distachyon TaxID=15368 RepID=UPI00052FE072|nr:F-box protein At5g03100 [Brachypodium distachyon]|eukprot:XP_010239188.1 F-box protein At5g03100 [Brachypodium distachyon]
MVGGGGGDLLGSLPDEVLQHVLSFLPSREAVQASALSHRWRDLWRSTPAVRVPGFDAGHTHGLEQAFPTFVNRFLLLRDGASPLCSLEIDVDLSDGDNYGENDHNHAFINKQFDLWIRHAAPTCRTLALAACISCKPEMLRLEARPLAASRHLTTLRLSCVKLGGGSLDFSRCPALLQLDLWGCDVDVEAIASPSLQGLSVVDCNLVPWPRRTTTATRISTPSLRRLQLSDCVGGALPCLESTPSLTTAIVRLSGDKREDRGTHCLILDALSEATTLELTASSYDGQVIFQRDLRWCPTFSKLKTLILNEWCVYDDETALATLLQHSPILENLIFELSTNCPYKLKVIRSYNTWEQLTFQHLKTVEIRCQVVSSKVYKVLKVLSACGVPLGKINIQGTTSQFECFNFVCTGFSSKEC